MDRRAFLVAAAFFPGCLGIFREEERDELREPEDVVVVWDTLIRDDPGTDDERVYVWGVVRNEGDRELSYVEVRATFLDGEGEEIDHVIEHVADVTSGAEWGFEIEFQDFGEEAAAVEGYELEVLTSL